MPAIPITRPQLLTTLPPVWPEDLYALIRAAVGESTTKLVVLDDDPTGTQTIDGLPVLTRWSVPVLTAELNANGPGFFILTNSRSLSSDAAAALSREIGTNLRRASALADAPVEIISRSDSTLRGHFPGEVDALMEAMDTQELPCILAPCFFEGGRLTVNDTHYVAEGDRLIPAAQTPYARDAVFGYRHSNLRRWVVEKNNRGDSGKRVRAISIEDLRHGGPLRVARQLLSLQAGDCCIVNAVEYHDLMVFVAGLMMVHTLENRRFIYRAASSLVRVRAGIEPKKLLSRSDLTLKSQRGGLFVVGSYVPKSNAQLAVLRNSAKMVAVEVAVDALLDNLRQPMVVDRATASINTALARGCDVVLFTSRDLVMGEDAINNLDIGRRVSQSLSNIIAKLEQAPRYLVAKGGITASDIATDALKVRRAVVMGQVLPGVPVWRLGNEARWPGLPYILFPGNVGEDNALAHIQKRLALT